MRLDGHLTDNGERKKAHVCLVGMPQGQIDLPLERARCRWKCIIKVELEGI